MEASFRNFRFLAPVNAAATPVVLLAAFAVLLNQGLKMSVSPMVVKWGLASVLVTNSFILASMVLGSVAYNLSPYLRVSSGKLDDFQLGILEYIDRCVASKDITCLFIYCGNNQPPQIREKAVLKIKSKTDWREDLCHTLEGIGVDEAFRFLSANDVDDKPRFAKGVYQAY